MSSNNASVVILIIRRRRRKGETLCTAAASNTPFTTSIEDGVWTKTVTKRKRRLEMAAYSEKEAPPRRRRTPVEKRNLLRLVVVSVVILLQSASNVTVMDALIVSPKVSSSSSSSSSLSRISATTINSITKTTSHRPSLRRTTVSSSLFATFAPSVAANATAADSILQIMEEAKKTSLSSSLPSSSISSLSSMTVPQLKQYVKDFGWNEKGLFTTKLKRKQDIVDYILAKQQQQQQNHHNIEEAKSKNGVSTPTSTATTKATTTATTTAAAASPPSTTRMTNGSKRAVSMPRKNMSSAGAVAANNNNSVSSSSSIRQRQTTSLDAMMERLYQQYPPLQYITTGYHQRGGNDGTTTTTAADDDYDDDNNVDKDRTNDTNTSASVDSSSLSTPLIRTATTTGLGEQDFRQHFHPMLQRHTATTTTATTSVDDNDVTTDLAFSKNKNVLSGDMDLIFVGTSSCSPSITRGVSCTALRLHMVQSTSKPRTKQRLPGTWIFDCGESTQLQVQRTTSIRPGKITKIFLTHAHGDHTFGLPGLLCLMGADGGNKSNNNNNNNGNDSGDNGNGNKRKQLPPQDPKVIDIYGPEGLRMWLRTAIRYSVSRIVPPYRVHELKDIPMAPEWTFSNKSQRHFFNLNNDGRGRWGGDASARDPSSWMARHDQLNLEPSSAYGEVKGGRDIYPHYDHPFSSHGAPIWEVEDEGDVKVYAAPMSHGIPCVGYVVKEEDRAGRLRDEMVRPICERNMAALKDAGFVHPLKAMQVIKDLPVGSSFTFPDGTVVSQEDAVEASRPGRKVVICGDTASARSMEKLSQGADVVVHEATNTYMNWFDRDSDMKGVTRDAMIHGHSTPGMAGRFTSKVGAKRLIMNHFSSRYPGDASPESMAVMTLIEDQALQASGLERDCVAAAWDFMIYPVPLGGSKEDDGKDGGFERLRH